MPITDREMLSAVLSERNPPLQELLSEAAAYPKKPPEKMTWRAGGETRRTA